MEQSYADKRSQAIEQGQGFNQLGEWFRLEAEVNALAKIAGKKRKIKILKDTPQVRAMRSWYWKELTKKVGITGEKKEDKPNQQQAEKAVKGAGPDKSTK